jgi:hypothetical protein
VGCLRLQPNIERGGPAIARTCALGAGYSLADLVLGKEVTFVRTSEPNPADRAPGAGAITQLPEPVVPGDSVPHTDLLLFACVKSKLDVPAAARDLYVSVLFQKERAYAERRGVPWFILSAEHGLVAPDEWLAPYERYLPDTPAGYRAAWGSWVVERLDLLAGPLRGRVVEVHAGATYVEAIAAHLAAKGATLVDPLGGLTMGERLAWYDSRGAGTVPADRTTVDASHVDVPPLVQRLRCETAGMTPTTFLDRQGAGLRLPGLYSWWIDEAGAADLSRGLGLAVPAGLIYAGLAGATAGPAASDPRTPCARVSRACTSEETTSSRPSAARWARSWRTRPAATASTRMRSPPGCMIT